MMVLSPEMSWIVLHFMVGIGYLGLLIKFIIKQGEHMQSIMIIFRVQQET